MQTLHPGRRKIPHLIRHSTIPILPMVYLSGLIFLLSVYLPSFAQTTQNDIRDITALELTRDMVTGWNLGNSFDVTNRDKTFWGNPLPSKEIIEAVEQKGFKTVRIPVTWGFHMGPGPDYIIEKEYLDEVETIIKHILDLGMYAILNTHHDDWIEPVYSKESEISDRLKKVWTQIANRFKDYNDYLIFETMNEPRIKNSPIEWVGNDEGRDMVNRYNQVCVDAIRATGGNNAERFLMIPTYAANTQPGSLSQHIIPNDDPKIIVSLHTYFPFEFTLKEDGTRNWGSAADKSALDAELDRIHDHFIANNRAVILGEWGAIDRSNHDDRVEHASYYARGAAERKLPTIVWDDGGQFQLLSRQELSWTFTGSAIATAIIAAVNDVYGILPLALNKLPENISDFYAYRKTGSNKIFIRYHLTRGSSVSLKILTIDGRQVRNLVARKKQAPGSYELSWNGEKDTGDIVSNGIYLVIITTEQSGKKFKVTFSRQ
ncbi:cellulase family glycosylhydrolase [Fulvivirgaceae bacterium BMA12]|uniref:Cellulase family glycosylhydrolase n=1 Tax=Agaribacillus aureus TaxID=3051825 RepID=A0ABT8L6X6_9BACT|nr:cellulase family glycosylhydrolase [Fulvivirgaceae bacterium BMA12]